MDASRNKRGKSEHSVLQGDVQQTSGDGLAPVISDDLLCTRCRYNLRTLSRQAACPECDTPIQVSLRDASLLAGTHYRRLAWAATALTLLAFLGLAEVGYLYPMRHGITRGWVPFGIDEFLINVLPWALALAFPPLLLASTLLLADFFPRPNHSPWPRRLVVAAAWLYCVPLFILFCTILAIHLWRAPGQWVSEFDVLFVQIETHASLDPMIHRWAWGAPLFYGLFLFLLASGAKVLHAFLRLAHRHFLARATLLTFAIAAFLPMFDLVVYFYLADHLHLTRSGLIYIEQLHTALYLLFYVPMLLYWPTILVVTRRMRLART